METTNIKFTSVDCRGLNNLIKRKHIINALIKQGAEIIMLQETHLNKKQTTVSTFPKLSQRYLAAGASNSRGVAILINRNIRYQVEKIHKDPLGRFFFKGSIGGERLTLVSLYAPNSGQLDFLKATFTKLGEFSDDPYIIGGDLNVIANSFLDRSRLKSRQTPFNKSISDFDTQLPSLLN